MVRHFWNGTTLFLFRCVVVGCCTPISRNEALVAKKLDGEKEVDVGRKGTWVIDV